VVVDAVVDKLVALGVPGLVLLVAIATMGVSGGAAIVAALAFLGGPFGMMGGIAVLGVVGLVSQALASYGLEAIFKAVVERLREQGKSHAEIRQELASYPISRTLKLSLLEHLDRLK
jgi:NADH:ubiquinone oxidoreductase subunit 4 (subunit M)